MKNFLKNNGLLIFTTLLLAGVLFSFGIYIGYTYQPEANKTVDSLIGQEAGMPPKVDFAAFWKAWNILNQKFVSAGTSTPVSNEEKVWGAISGLTESLNDPYTVFFPPEESKMFQSDIAGNFEGVGMEIGEKDGVLVVVSPLKGTPAYNAGILPGDKILKIDDKITAGMIADEAVKIIRGPKGTTVTFTLSRNGSKPFEVKVVRDVIDIPVIETEKRPDGVFVISLYSFSANSPDLFREALREFVQSGTNKLILDLRGNPGGYLEAAVDMASWFLPIGEVVVKEGSLENQNQAVYRSKGYDVFGDNLKFVVLVDGGSASAAEILAGALREHNIATLVGSKTFGKGSVQELLPVTKDTSIKVTIARWFTPKGVSISNNGLNPDVVVNRTAEDVSKNRDPQLEKAASLLLSM